MRNYILSIGESTIKIEARNLYELAEILEQNYRGIVFTLIAIQFMNKGVK